MSFSDAQRLKRVQFARIAADQFNDERAYSDLTTAALQVCGGKIALISLHDTDKMWFRTRVGLEAHDIPKERSFCECAMAACDQILMVEDAAADPRFADNPLVTGPLGIRFYVGAPMRLSSGQVLGNLCVMDSEPKKLAAEALELLDFLSKQVAQMLEKSGSWVRPPVAQ